MSWPNIFKSQGKGKLAEIQELTSQLKDAFREVRKAQAAEDRLRKALDDQARMMDEMANAAGGMIWRKDAEGNYMFANHLHCVEFFGIESCYEYLDRNDEDMIAAFVERTGKHHTFLPNCKLIDAFTNAKGEKCHFIEFGYVGDKGMVLNLIVSPVFTKEGAFDGTVGFAFDVSSICNTWAARVAQMTEAGSAIKLSDGAFYIKHAHEVCNDVFDAMANPKPVA